MRHTKSDWIDNKPVEDNKPVDDNNIVDGDSWLEDIKARGLGGALRITFDALSPLSPLAAQLLYIAQPVCGLWGWHGRVGEIARALEDPQQMEAIRQRLEKDETR